MSKPTTRIMSSALNVEGVSVVIACAAIRTVAVPLVEVAALQALRLLFDRRSQAAGWQGRIVDDAGF